MAAAKVGDTVYVKGFGKGRVTSLRKGYVRVKFGDGPGRPRDIDVSDVKLKHINALDIAKVALKLGVNATLSLNGVNFVAFDL